MASSGLWLCPDEQSLSSLFANTSWKHQQSNASPGWSLYSTQRFNRRHKRDGALFRGRYKAILVEEETYLNRVVRYIHLNPVNASLVKEPKDYKWSSHKNYLGREMIPRWLKAERLLRGFKSVDDFDAFVCEGNEKSLDEFYKKKRMKSLLGNESFAMELQEKTKNLSKEHSREDRKYFQSSFEQVLKEICCLYRMEVERIKISCRGVDNEARRVASYLGYELCGLTQKEIAKELGVGSYKTAAWMRDKVRLQMQEDSSLKAKIEQIKMKFQN